MLGLATVCWGVSFPLIKAQGQLSALLLPEAGGMFFTAMTVAPRFWLAALVVVAWRPRACFGLTRSEWKQGVGLGAFAAVGMILQNDGLHYTEASTSAFLTQLYAVLIPLWLALRTRRNPGGAIWGAVALVLAGGAMLAGFDPRALALGRGEAETLACSVFFMGQILWLERPEFAGNRVLSVTVIMFGVQAVVGTGLAAVSGGGLAEVATLLAAPGWWGIMLVLTVVCTLAAYLLMNTYQPRITSTEAGLIYCAEPIFGSLAALMLPALLSGWLGLAYANETLTLTLLVGGGLITLANVLVQLRPPPQPTLAPSVATAETRTE